MSVEAVVFASEQAWHKHRATSLGSSDAPTIVGVSSFDSPYSLWAVKTGLLEESFEYTRRLRAGHALESAIHDELLEERPDIDLFDPGDFAIVYDQRFKWRHATVDRLYGPAGCFKELNQRQLVLGYGHEKEAAKIILEALELAEGVAEFKTVSGWMKESWSDEPSAYALVQTHHQMLVTGKKKAIVAAWFGLGEDFKVYDLEAVEALIDGVDRAETRFQLALDTNEPPDPDESERTSKAIAATYSRVEPVTIELPPEAARWQEKRIKAKAKAKEANAQVREAENWLKEMIGEAEAGEIPGVGTVTWKEIPAGEPYQVEPKPYRKLGFRKPKKEKE